VFIAPSNPENPLKKDTRNNPAINQNLQKISQQLPAPKKNK
jgi:hypothetical protein